MCVEGFATPSVGQPLSRGFVFRLSASRPRSSTRTMCWLLERGML